MRVKSGRIGAGVRQLRGNCSIVEMLETREQSFPSAGCRTPAPYTRARKVQVSCTYCCLQGCCETGALINRALRVQFGRYVRPADHVACFALRLQRIRKTAV